MSAVNNSSHIMVQSSRAFTEMLNVEQNSRYVIFDHIIVLLVPFEDAYDIKMPKEKLKFN